MAEPGFSSLDQAVLGFGYTEARQAFRVQKRAAEGHGGRDEESHPESCVSRIQESIGKAFNVKFQPPIPLHMPRFLTSLLACIQVGEQNI